MKAYCFKCKKEMEIKINKFDVKDNYIKVIGYCFKCLSPLCRIIYFKD